MIRPVVWAAAALFGVLPAASAAPAAPGAAGVERRVSDPRLAEMSGLAPSLEHPGVLWTHNDSGNAPVIYGLAPDGAVAAAVRVHGVAGYDWEAIAAFRDATGQACLAVADTGDNLARRSSVQIVLLAEPVLRDATVSPRRVLTLRYPDGPADAEALLVDASAGQMYLVTKGLGGVLYRVPADVWPGPAGAAPADHGTLERIAGVPLLLVTDGVMGPGHHPVVRTYGELAVLPPITADVVGGTLEPLGQARLPDQRQGEGLALGADGAVLLSSEGVGQPILRMPMPPALAAVLRPVSPASPASPGARGPSASPGSPASRVMSWPVVAAAMALAALAGVLAGRSRRRSPR